MSINKVTDMRSFIAKKQAISNSLTDDQKELLLFAQYAVKMALVELSELNTQELSVLGELGETLAVQIEHTKQSLHGSKQLVIALISEGVL